MAWYESNGNSGGSLELKSASGDIATFETNLAAPLQSVIVDVVASQPSGTPTPSTPLPITGYSSANITRCGKNIWQLDEASIGLNYNGNANAKRYNQTFRVPYGTYTFSRSENADDFSELFVGVAKRMVGAGFDIGADSSRKNLKTNATQTVTVDATYPYLFINCISVADTMTATIMNGVKLQAEVGSSPSAYAPYNGQTYTIAFGQTVYGGVLDVTRGKLHVTHGKYTLNDASNLSRNSDHSFYFGATPAPKATGTAYYVGVMSDKFMPGETANQDVIFIHPNGLVRFNTANAYQSASDCFTAIGEITVVYPLATPFDIDLTPEVISAIVGENNVFADCGSSAVEFVNKASDETAMICSTGGQSITLPVKASEHLTFKFDLYFLYGNGDFCLMADVWSGSGWLVHTRYWDLAFRYDAGGGSHVFPITPYTKKSIEVNTFDGTLIIDGNVKTTGHTVSYTSGEYIRMFGMNASNSCMASVGVVDVYKDDVLYMHLVPKKDENTGAGYYYDTIGGQSYYSETANPLVYAEM